MRKLKNIGIGLGALLIATGISILGQLHNDTRAANTLLGDNEVITINDTTDNQPINAPFNPIDYSADGNIILFKSDATNLPNGGNPGGLYTYNIQANTTSRIDISTNGTLPNSGLFDGAGGGQTARISETGRYVTFSSMATNLIEGTIQPQRVIYKHDTQTHATTKIGVGHTGGYSDKWDRNLAISNDGRFSLVSSRNIAGAYPYSYGTAIGDGESGTYAWTQLGGGGSNDTAGTGGLSCDGTFMVNQSSTQIKLMDLRKGIATTLTTGLDNSASPIISCNGRYVLYATNNRTQITPTPTNINNKLHLVRYDRITGERMYVDSDSLGVFSSSEYIYAPTYNNIQSNVFNASISDRGDVVFNYTKNGNTYTYLKHLSDKSGTLEPIAKTTSGGSINVSNGKITSDGRYIFFKADPYDLGLTTSPSGIQLIRTKTHL